MQAWVLKLVLYEVYKSEYLDYVKVQKSYRINSLLKEKLEQMTCFCCNVYNKVVIFNKIDVKYDINISNGWFKFI